MSGPDRERWPKDVHAWTRHPVPVPIPGAISASMWQCGPVRVLSALELAEAPDGTHDVVPQWNISISARGKRPKDNHVRKALRAFGMVGAEEDNHHPGNARHFWLPVDPARRVGCECKATEVVHVDADGYTWTNPADGVVCRGCEFEVMTGKPCPLHGSQAGAATPVGTGPRDARHEAHRGGAGASGGALALPPA